MKRKSMLLPASILLLLFASLLNASDQDTIEVKSFSGWGGGHGLALISKENKLEEILEIKFDIYGKEIGYIKRKISNKSKADSLFEAIINSNFRILRNQRDLVGGMGNAQDGSRVNIDFKANGIKRYLEYDNPNVYNRIEDQIVSKILLQVQEIENSCLSLAIHKIKNGKSTQPTLKKKSG